MAVHHLEIRKIKPEEFKRVKELCAIAFEYSQDNEKSADEVLKGAKTNPEYRAELHFKEHWAAFDDDGTTMMGCMATIPYDFHFDGHHCQMWGIGGVATLPPYRRRGGIRGCFEQALPDMYAQGASFSYLYPFSTAYYRKFGYELCCPRQEYRLLIEKIPYTPQDGTLHLVEQGKPMLEEIQTVYRAWQETYNMMVVASDFEFRWANKANPFKDQEYTYVYKSGSGLPKAYASFRKVDEESGRNLQCSRFLFTDVEGFYGLINLFTSLGADHRYVTFVLPENQYVVPLLPEWSLGAGTRETTHYGMARVVNVEKVLRMARTRGQGTVVLEIVDAQIHQNNARFAVRYQDGAVQDVQATQAAPDATLTIQEFSRLIIGIYDIDAIPYLRGVTVHTDAARLSGLFFRKPVYICEYF